jgi:hypothetical protein
VTSYRTYRRIRWSAPIIRSLGAAEAVLSGGISVVYPCTLCPWSLQWKSPEPLHHPTVRTKSGRIEREVVDGQQESTRFARTWAGAREPTWLNQSGDWDPGPARTSRSPEVRWPTPTPAAVKMRVFGFID